MFSTRSMKLEVTHAVANDKALGDALTLALGYTPLWSRLDIIGVVKVWLIYKSLVSADQSYYEAYLALDALPEAYGNMDTS